MAVIGSWDLKAGCPGMGVSGMAGMGGIADAPSALFDLYLICFFERCGFEDHRGVRLRVFDSRHTLAIPH